MKDKTDNIHAHQVAILVSPVLFFYDAGAPGFIDNWILLPLISLFMVGWLGLQAFSYWVADNRRTDHITTEQVRNIPEATDRDWLLVALAFGGWGLTLLFTGMFKHLLLLGIIFGVMMASRSAVIEWRNELQDQPTEKEES